MKCIFSNYCKNWIPPELWIYYLFITYCILGVDTPQYTLQPSHSDWLWLYSSSLCKPLAISLCLCASRSAFWGIQLVIISCCLVEREEAFPSPSQPGKHKWIPSILKHPLWALALLYGQSDGNTLEHTPSQPVRGSLFGVSSYEACGPMNIINQVGSYNSCRICACSENDENHYIGQWW